MSGNLIVDAVSAAGSQTVDKNTRSQAEDYLVQSLQRSPGETLVELLRIGTGTSQPVVDLDLQLLAIIRVKRFFVDEMGPENTRMLFPPAILSQLKAIVLPALPNLELRRRRQMVEVVGLLQQTGWPELIPALVQVLQEPVAPAAKGRHQAAVEALYKATKEYKNFGGKKHSDFQKTADAVLPLLPPLFAHQDVHMARLCLKIFECFIARTTPDLLNKNPTLFDSWMKFLLEFPTTFSALAQIQDDDDDDYIAFLKCVKRIGSISITLLQEARAKKSGVKRMSHYFAKTYSVNFGHFWVNWLRFVKAKDATKHYKPNRFAISFLTEALNIQRVYEGALKPIAAELLTELMFRPYIPFNAEDEELFNSDPGQFLVENNFEGAKELSLRGMATSFIKKMVAAKKPFHDKNLLAGLLQYLGSGLQEPDGPITDGCFELLMSLKKEISNVPELWNCQMETVIGQYVVPRLKSPLAFVKSKAVQLVGRFSTIPYSTEEIYATVINAVLACAQETHVVVCVCAFSAVNTFLVSKRAKPYVKPLVGPIAKEVLRLLPLTHSELLIISLRLLVEKFTAELRNSMPEIVNGVVQHCLATHFTMQSGLTEGEDANGEVDQKQLFAIDSQMMTLITSLKTLEAIFEQLQYDHEMVVRLQPDAARIVTELLRDEENAGMAQEMSEMVRVMVFAGGNAIAPEMWGVLSQLWIMLPENLGLFEDYSGVIDNMLSCDPAGFLADPKHLNALVDVYKTIMAKRLEVSAEIAGQAAQLISSAFQHFKSHHAAFDAAAAALLNITLTTLMVAEDPTLKIMLCNVVMDALYYSPNNTVGLMQHSGALPHFLTNYFTFFETSKKDDRSYDQLERKVQVLGVLSLLHSNAIEESMLPAALGVLHHCVTRNGQCYEAFLNDTEGKDPTADLDAELGSDDDSEFGDPDMDDEFDEDANVEDADLENMMGGGEDDGEHLDVRGGRQNRGALNDMSDEVETPINDVCEVDLVLQWLQHVQASSPAIYQKYCAQVPISEYQKASQFAHEARNRIQQLKTVMQQHYFSRAQQ